MVCLSMRYSLFKRLLKSRTHVDLHQTEPVPPGGACVGNSDPVRPCREGCARLVESPLTRDVGPRCRSLLARITAAFFSGATAGTGRRVAHRMSGSGGPPLG